jgi:hypothetical protein
MNTEVNTILNNIFSLLSEIKQMETGEMGMQQVADNLTQTGVELQPKQDVKMQAGKPNVDNQQAPTSNNTENENMNTENENSKEDEKEDANEVKKFVKKTLVETPSESATANDGAVERLEDYNTDITEENLMEIAKAIMNVAKGKKTVAKSVGSDAMNTIAKSIELLTNKVTEQDKALNSILKGLGVADEIMRVEKSQPVRKAENSVNDVNKSMDYIVAKLAEMSGVTKNENSVSGHPQTEVRKSFANKEFLSQLITGKGR